VRSSARLVSFIHRLPSSTLSLARAQRHAPPRPIRFLTFSPLAIARPPKTLTTRCLGGDCRRRQRSAPSRRRTARRVAHPLRLRRRARRSALVPRRCELRDEAKAATRGGSGTPPRPTLLPYSHSIAAIYVPIAVIAAACDCERIRLLPRGFCRCGLPLVVAISVLEGEGFWGFRPLGCRLPRVLLVFGESLGWHHSFVVFPCMQSLHQYFAAK